MDAVVIHTFGHLDIFKAVFQALAVLFDPLQTDFFVSSDGMGLGIGATLAATIALIGTGFNWFDTQKFAPHTALYGMILYSLMFIPKMPEVWLSDLYTGRTEVVNNVPFGIAVIGNAFSTIAIGISRSFSTQYSSPGAVDNLTYTQDLVGGNGVGGNGFLSPLKALLYFRHNSFEYMPKFIRHNVIAYQRSCISQSIDSFAPPDPAFDYNAMKELEDPFAYFFNGDFIHDYNVYKMNIDGSVVLSNCYALNTELSGASAASIHYQITDPNVMGAYTYQNTVKQSNYDEFLSESQNGVVFNESRSLTETQGALESIMSNGVNSQNFMMSVVARDIAKNGQEFAHLPPGTLDDYVVTMTTSIEQSKILQAVEGDDFLHWSLTAMSALQFLFYALTPIVGLAMVAKGAGAFKYLGSYLLFGFWVYSWIPVASAINFWTIGGFMETFNAMTGAMSITPEIVDSLIGQGETAIAVGANLLAMTPLITFAILSGGGAFAMTSLAQAANPKGGAAGAAAMLTPPLRDNPSLAKMKGQYEQAAAGSTVGGSNQAIAQLKSQSFGSQYQQQQTASTGNGLTHRASSAVATTTQSALGNMQSYLASNKSDFSASNVASLGVNTSQGISAAMKSMGINASQLTKSETDSISGAIKTGVGGKLLSVAGDVNKRNGTNKDYSQRDIEAAEAAFVSGTTISNTNLDSKQRSVSQSHQNSFNKSQSQLATDSEKLEKAQQYQQEMKSEDAQTKQAGYQTSKDGQELWNDLSASGNINNSWDSAESFVGNRFKESAMQAGYSAEDSNQMWQNFAAQNQSNFENSPLYSPDQSNTNSASALSSLMTSLGQTNADPLMNSIQKDTMRGVLDKSGNANLATNKNMATKLDNVPGNINAQGGALVAKVSEGQKQTKGDIQAGTTSLQAGSKFNPSELKPIHEGNQNLSDAFNKISGGTDNIYGNLFEQKSNEIAQKNHGKNFSELKGNQARSVAGQASDETFRQFTQDFNQLRASKADSGALKTDKFNSEYIDKLDDGSSDMLGTANKQMHDGKVKGSVAKGAFGNYAETFKGATKNLQDFEQTRYNAEDAERNISANKADKAADIADTKSEINKQLFGKAGVSTSTMDTSNYTDDYQNLSDGQTQESVNNQLDSDIISMLNNDQSTTSPNNNSAILEEWSSFIPQDTQESLQNLINTSNSAPIGSPTADFYNAKRDEGFSPLQSLSLTANQFGQKGDGDFTSAFAGVTESGVKGEIAGGAMKLGAAFATSGASLAIPQVNNAIDGMGTIVGTVEAVKSTADLVNNQTAHNNANDTSMRASAREMATTNVSENVGNIYNKGTDEQKALAIQTLDNIASSAGISQENLYNVGDDGQLNIKTEALNSYLEKGDQLEGRPGSTTSNERFKQVYAITNAAKTDSEYIDIVNNHKGK